MSSESGGHSEGSGIFLSRARQELSQGFNTSYEGPLHSEPYTTNFGPMPTGIQTRTCQSCGLCVSQCGVFGKTDEKKRKELDTAEERTGKAFLPWRGQLRAKTESRHIVRQCRTKSTRSPRAARKGVPCLGVAGAGT